MKYLLISLFLISCAPKPEDKITSVKFQLPASRGQSSLRHYSPKSQFGSNTLASLNDIDCYGIVVEHGLEFDPLNPPANFDPSQFGGVCVDSSNNPVTGGNEVFGSFPQGSNIEIFVSSGPARTFHLYGFSYNSAVGTQSCPDFINFSIVDQQASSKPVLLASRTVDVQGEFMEVSMTRTTDVSTAPVAHTCKNSPFNWETSSISVWDVAQWDSSTWGP